MLGGPPFTPSENPGSRDGAGAGDHDQPFRKGDHLTTASFFPFTAREFARLLCLRSHVQDGDRVPEVLVLAAPDQFGLAGPVIDNEPAVLDQAWGE